MDGIDVKITTTNAREEDAAVGPAPVPRHTRHSPGLRGNTPNTLLPVSDGVATFAASPEPAQAKQRTPPVESQAVHCFASSCGTSSVVKWDFHSVLASNMTCLQRVVDREGGGTGCSEEQQRCLHLFRRQARVG